MVNKIMTEFSTVLSFNNASARKNISNEKLEVIEDGFETWNHCLQDGYAPGSYMTADELHSKVGLHFVYIRL